MIGILGFVLVTISAGRLAGKLLGFDWVQCLAALCAGCYLVTMAMQGIDLAVWIGTLLLPVLEILLVYAALAGIWTHVRGRKPHWAGGGAVCHAAVRGADSCSNVLALGIVGGIQI